MFAADFRRHRALWVLAISGSILTGGLFAGQAATAEGWPSRVSANYNVVFNGFKIGKFSFATQTDRSGYHATSSAKLRAFFGAFRWKGSSQSKGSLGRSMPQPAAYSFVYRSKSDGGSLSMKFQARKIASLVSVPPTRPSKKRVPLKSQHLQGVLDPLSAVMALTRVQPAKRGANPCRRTLSIFDGTQRFDLVLSYHRRTRIREARPSGLPTTAYVCRVRYVPIAGYKPTNRTTRYMAKVTGIEVVLRPVPEAGILIPHKVTVPTMVGSASLVSNRVHITTSGRRQIALVN